MHITPSRIHSSLMNCSNKVIFLRFYNELKFHMFSGIGNARAITRYQNINFVKKVDIALLCCEPSTIRYNTIRYDSVYLTCSKKLTGSQLSLPHGTNKKLKCKTKNKMMSVIGPVQSRYCEAVQ